MPSATATVRTGRSRSCWPTLRNANGPKKHCMKPTAARTSFWRYWHTSCATRWHPSATRCRYCATRAHGPAAGRSPGRQPDRQWNDRTSQGKDGCGAGSADGGGSEQTTHRFEGPSDVDVAAAPPHHAGCGPCAPGAGRLQSPEQRGALLAAGRPYPSERRTRGKRSARVDQGQWPRYPSRRPGKHLRPVRAGRPAVHPARRRFGHRPVTGAHDGSLARGPGARTQRRTRQGQRIHRQAADPSGAGAGAASFARPRREQVMKVLVVDDNHDAATSLSMLVDLLGHEVRTAFDGVEALDLASEFNPDVVLLDLGMPRMDGYEACRRLRAQPWGAHMTVVAVTGWGREDDRLRTEMAGFDQHLVKPVAPAVIATMLNGAAPQA